jgi:hypothetical protein
MPLLAGSISEGGLIDCTSSCSCHRYTLGGFEPMWCSPAAGGGRTTRAGDTRGMMP